MSHADILRHLDFGGMEEYRKLDFPPPERRAGRLSIDRRYLGKLAESAFSDIAFRFPRHHLEKLAAIIADGNASPQERFVAATLLRNAAVAAEGILPTCQDTGTALIYGWKGEGCEIQNASGREDGDKAAETDDAACLAGGAASAYASHRLRASQMGPESALSERNTRDNLPALVDIRAVAGREYRFLFAAKGGGSTSRTSLSMEAPSILKPEELEKVLASRIKALGASGCPPYTIAVVLGGASPSQALYALELAAFGLLDGIPGSGNGDGSPLRSREWEEIVMRLAEDTGIGAQWGGRHLALEARVIRLSRHAANLPLAVGVSCSAHRKARAIINENGWFLEKMEEDPGRLLPASLPLLPGAGEIDLDAPRDVWLERLRRLPAGSIVLLSGTVTVARDAAHARLSSALKDGRPLPAYFSDHPIFYAGPTEPAPGAATGSFGPTTASRMDSYLDTFMGYGASLVTIAKGSRGAEARTAIASHAGVYLACVGGAAALTARNHVEESRIVDFPDLGMESVRLVRLKKLPAIVAIDARGASIYC